MPVPPPPMPPSPEAGTDRRPWIKICANTSVEDALLGVELGADALGFVFAPSPRQVTAPQVHAISAQLPEAVERVGVFTSASAAEVARTVEQAGLHTVQMHGPRSDAQWEELAHALPPGTRMLPVVHFSLGEDAQGEARRVARTLDELAALRPGARILVDAKSGNASGGLGVAFDWHAAAPVFQPPQNHARRNLRLILAGGLNPGNVLSALATLHPWGIDVASGVESSPGKKDPRRLRLFIEAARSHSS